MNKKLLLIALYSLVFCKAIAMEGYIETEGYENDSNGAEPESGENSGDVDGATIYLENPGDVEIASVTPVEDGYNEPTAPVVEIEQSATEAGGDLGFDINSDPNETTDISEEQLQSEAKEAAENALKNGNPIWRAIVELFEKIFSGDTWKTLGEKIKTDILNALKEVSGASSQLAKEVQDDSTSVEIINTVTDFGSTESSIIIDIFNDVCNDSNGTTGKTYINNPSYEATETEV